MTCALLTGSTPARRRADTLGKLAGGELSLIVGTHALIEPDVEFRALAVAVVDEQHRFGVRQRAALDAKAGVGANGQRTAPHVLHMTATPIPRTLALANYGDLDTTMLRELPRGRQPIDTRIVSGESERERAYESCASSCGAGRQAYVVCPLIEQAEDDEAGETAAPSDLRTATAELERLRKGELKRPSPGAAARRDEAAREGAGDGAVRLRRGGRAGRDDRDRGRDRRAERDA